MSPLLLRNMAKSRPGQEIPDDIELLNIHAFPDSVSSSRLSFVRKSKICQKRLEELLRDLPGHSGRNVVKNPNILFQVTPEENEEAATDPDAENESEQPTSVVSRILKFIFP